MKSAPPGWQPHQIMTRVDGWLLDPADEDRIPTAVAELIAQAMPQPGDDTVAAIRRRMYARHKKVLGHD